MKTSERFSLTHKNWTFEVDYTPPAEFQPETLYIKHVALKDVELDKDIDDLVDLNDPDLPIYERLLEKAKRNYRSNEESKDEG